VTYSHYTVLWRVAPPRAHRQRARRGQPSRCHHQHPDLRNPSEAVLEMIRRACLGSRDAPWPEQSAERGAV